MPRKKSQSLVVGLIVLECLTYSTAKADVRIVNQVTVTGGPSRLNSQTSYVTIFKRDKARRETQTQDGEIVIFDKPGNKVLVLKPENKTYYVGSFADAWRNGIDTAGINVKFNLQKQNSGTTRAVSNRPVVEFSLLASVTQERKQEDDGRSGVPGDRSKPSENKGSGGSRGTVATKESEQSGASVEVTGSLFACKFSEVLPISEKDLKSLSIPLVQKALPPLLPVLDPLTQQLSKNKIVMLSSVLTARWLGNQAGIAPLVVKNQITSIESIPESSDALFAIPNGYKKVAAPPKVKIPLR